MQGNSACQDMCSKMVAERAALIRETMSGKDRQEADCAVTTFYQAMEYFTSRNADIRTDRRLCKRAVKASSDYALMYSKEEKAAKRIRELNRLETSIASRLPFKQTMATAMWAVVAVTFVCLLVRLALDFAMKVTS